MNSIKELVLTGVVQSKLLRLPTEVKKIYFTGLDPEILARKPCVAVIGSRKMSPYGKQVTEIFVTELVSAGVVVISGLAFGVDITAHKAALRAGGETIAVVASDLSHIYPASHRLIAQEITHSGCIISEHHNNSHPHARHFLERNRIIAALSDAVLIPEAAEKSGSLNTAHWAQQMNIPLFSVPGRITDSLSVGTNSLIHSAQALIATSAKDILNRLDVNPSDAARTHTKFNNETEALIYSYIQSAAFEPVKVQSELRLSTPQLQVALTSLELNGLAAQDELGCWHTT